MAKTWLPKAADLRDIWTITVPTASAWAEGDQVILTLGEKNLTVTLGSQAEDNQVAQAITDGWNASTRLTGSNANTNATSNFGGQEFGEFSEALATVADRVVTITGVTPGTPIELEVGFVSGTSADLDVAHEQQATGKNWWDNPSNWLEGTVPQDQDDLILQDTSISILWGFPVDLGTTDPHMQLNIYQYSTFVAQVGLPPTNITNGNKPYTEYRNRGPVLDDGLANGNSTWHFGIGEGPGSPLINLGYTGPVGKVTVRCHGMAEPAVGNHALNLATAGAGASRISVLGGSVSMAPQFGLVHKMDLVDVSGSQTNVFMAGNSAAACTFTISDGTVRVFGDHTSVDVWTLNGGTTTFQDYKTTSIALTIDGGTAIWNSTNNILSAVVSNTGVFNAEADVRPFLVAACDLYRGASWLDDFARGTYSAGVDLNRCGIDDVTLRVGNNKRLTLSAVA